MTAREFIEFLHRYGVTEKSPLRGASPVFAKGALSNWRMFLIANDYENFGSMTRFVTINNLEDYEVRIGVSNKLYQSNVCLERYNDNDDFTVTISRQRYEG